MEMSLSRHQQMRNAIAFFDKAHNKLGIHGVVRFHQCAPGMPTCITFDFHGLKPGATHAIHIHEFGNLTEGCKSAGPHYNPHNTVHGSIWVGGPRHAGDLINNIVGDVNGRFTFRYEDALVNLFGDNGVIGRTVVLHANQDDLGLGNNKESKVTGNAGDRIACSIIGIDK